jgi:surface polysaccharide O-acyltransferase-like enzyme
MQEESMSETHQQSHVLRSIGAVLAGLLVIVIVTTATDLALHATGVFPSAGEPMTNSLWLLATAYRIVYGVAGSFIAARLAPNQPMRHALALGVVGLALSIVGAVMTWDRGPGFGPKWYPLALVVIAIPSAWLGGKLSGGR